MMIMNMLIDAKPMVHNMDTHGCIDDENRNATRNFPHAPDA